MIRRNFLKALAFLPSLAAIPAIAKARATARKDAVWYIEYMVLWSGVYKPLLVQHCTFTGFEHLLIVSQDYKVLKSTVYHDGVLVTPTWEPLPNGMMGMTL